MGGSGKKHSIIMAKLTSTKWEHNTHIPLRHYIWRLVLQIRQSYPHKFTHTFLQTVV